MEDVLAVYTRPRDPDIPLVCLDETSKQLIAETRAPIKMKKGQSARFDYEYERNGTANLFMMFAPLEDSMRVSSGRGSSILGCLLTKENRNATVQKACAHVHHS